MICFIFEPPLGLREIGVMELKAIYTNMDISLSCSGSIGVGVVSPVGEGYELNQGRLMYANLFSESIDMALAIESGSMQHQLTPVFGLPDFRFLGFQSVVSLDTDDGRSVIIDRPILLASSLGVLSIFLKWYIRQLEDYHLIWERAGDGGHALPLLINERVSLDEMEMLTPQMAVDLSECPIVVCLPYRTDRGSQYSLVGEVNRWCSKGLNVILELDSINVLDACLLHSLPILGVKLSRCVVEEMMRDDSKRVIGGAIIAAIRGLGLDVIVENIESAERLDIFREYDVDAVMGAYFGSPITHHQLACLLSRGLLSRA